MEYLYFKKNNHRDLKSDNMVITKELKWKITDFGVSRVINDENSNGKTMKIRTSCYMAPEVVLTNNYSFKCVIFSYLYQVLSEKIENS